MLPPRDARMVADSCSACASALIRNRSVLKISNISMIPSEPDASGRWFHAEYLDLKRLPSATVANESLDVKTLYAENLES